MYKSAFLTVLGTAALGFASKCKGSLSRYMSKEKLNELINKEWASEWSKDVFSITFLNGENVHFFRVGFFTVAFITEDEKYVYLLQLANMPDNEQDYSKELLAEFVRNNDVKHLPKIEYIDEISLNSIKYKMYKSPKYQDVNSATKNSFLMQVEEGIYTYEEYDESDVKPDIPMSVQAKKQFESVMNELKSFRDFIKSKKVYKQRVDFNDRNLATDGQHIVLLDPLVVWKKV